MHTHSITRNYMKVVPNPDLTFPKIHDDMLEEMTAFFGTSNFDMSVSTVDEGANQPLTATAIGILTEEDEYDEPEPKDYVPTSKLDNLIGGRQIFPSIR